MGYYLLKIICVLVIGCVCSDASEETQVPPSDGNAQLYEPVVQGSQLEVDLSGTVNQQVEIKEKSNGGSVKINEAINVNTQQPSLTDLHPQAAQREAEEKEKPPRTFHVGHKLLGDHQSLDKLFSHAPVNTEDVATRQGPTYKEQQPTRTFHVGHKLLGDHQSADKLFSQSELETVNVGVKHGLKEEKQKPTRTFHVGHKLLGDHQSADKYFPTIEIKTVDVATSMPVVYSVPSFDSPIAAHDETDPMSTLPVTSIIEKEKNNIYSPKDEEAEGQVNNEEDSDIDKTMKTLPEPPSIEIDAIIQEPNPTQETDTDSVPVRDLMNSDGNSEKTHQSDYDRNIAPSGRRLVAIKGYEQAPSALSLVAGLPQDSGHLQILTNFPHHGYVHLPKVYPVTPSPELSGPLLGGPPIPTRHTTNLQGEKSKTSQIYMRHRPTFGRTLFFDSPKPKRTLQQQIFPSSNDAAPTARSLHPNYFQKYPRFQMQYPPATTFREQNLFPMMQRRYENNYYDQQAHSYDQPLTVVMVPAESFQYKTREHA